MSDSLLVKMRQGHNKAQATERKRLPEKTERRFRKGSCVLRSSKKDLDRKCTNFLKPTI